MSYLRSRVGTEIFILYVILNNDLINSFVMQTTHFLILQRNSHFCLPEYQTTTITAITYNNPHNPLTIIYLCNRAITLSLLWQTSLGSCFDMENISTPQTTHVRSCLHKAIEILLWGSSVSLVSKRHEAAIYMKLVEMQNQPINMK